MLSQQQLTEAIGTKAYGPDGDEIGRVEHFFVDDRTGAPTWVAVTTGLFGTRHSIVPALDAQLRRRRACRCRSARRRCAARRPRGHPAPRPRRGGAAARPLRLDAGGRAAVGDRDARTSPPTPR